jgi:dihydrofolate reductase
MGRLIYGYQTSLDGYISDASGSFSWVIADEEAHGIVGEVERGVTMHLYGRRLYETMVYWADPALLGHEEAFIADYARQWQGLDKVVISSTLHETRAARTSLLPRFDAGAIAAMKAEHPGDIGIGGADIAAQALRAGLVDEIYQFVQPVIVGGGTPFLPRDVRLDLALVEARPLASGVVFLHHRVR